MFHHFHPAMAISDCACVKVVMRIADTVQGRDESRHHSLHQKDQGHWRRQAITVLKNWGPLNSKEVSAQQRFLVRQSLFLRRKLVVRSSTNLIAPPSSIVYLGKVCVPMMSGSLAIPSGVTQNRPYRVTSKPAIEK